MGWLKKLTKPISKVLDKIIPNEIKPALPYLSAAAPFMLGPGIMGSTMLKRALMSGALNLGSQLSQEGSEGDFNPLSLAMASGIGALSAPGTPEVVGSAGETITAAQPGAEKFFIDKAAGMDDGLMKSGLKMLGKGSEYLTGAAKTLQNEPFTKEGLKAAIVPFSQGTADLAMISAQQALDEYNAGLDEGSDAWYDDNARRTAIRSAMEAAGHVEDDILDALSSLGLRQGGIVGLRNGGPIREKYGIGGNISKNPTNTPYDSRASITDMAKAIQSSSAGTDNQKLRMLMDYNMSVNPDVTPKNVMFDQANMEKLLGLQPNPNFNYMKPSGPAMLMPPMASTEFRQDPGNFGNEGIIINGKRYMSEEEAIEDMGIETYNRFMADGGIIGLRNGGRIGFDNGGDVEEGIMMISETATPKFGTKEYYEQKVSEEIADLKAMVAQDKLYHFSPWSIGMIEDLMMKADRAGVDISELSEVYNQTKDIHSKWYSSIPEKEKNMWKNMWQEDFNRTTDMGIFPGQQEFGWGKHLKDKKDAGEAGEKNIPAPKQDTFNAYEPLYKDAKDGGRINKEGGGMMTVLPRGAEMDYRGGGMIPMGSKERADDVPARLSKNEFVMTADAVRAAGGGSVNRGAKRMYDLMHNLEARV